MTSHCKEEEGKLRSFSSVEICVFQTFLLEFVSTICFFVGSVNSHKPQTSFSMWQQHALTRPIAKPQEIKWPHPYMYIYTFVGMCIKNTLFLTSGYFSYSLTTCPFPFDP